MDWRKWVMRTKTRYVSVQGVSTATLLGEIRAIFKCFRQLNIKIRKLNSKNCDVYRRQQWREHGLRNCNNGGFFPAILQLWSFAIFAKFMIKNASQSYQTAKFPANSSCCIFNRADSSNLYTRKQRTPKHVVLWIENRLVGEDNGVKVRYFLQK